MTISTAQIIALAPEAVRVQRACGWALADWSDVFAVKLYCVQRECSELVEALERGTHTQAAEEMADVGLYLVTTIAAFVPEWPTRSHPHAPSRYAAPAALVQPIRAYVDQAFERWRRSPSTIDRDAIIALEIALLETCRLAAALDVDLRAEMVRKCAKNEARGERHGLKRSSS